jgi:hypothetical protein
MNSIAVPNFTLILMLFAVAIVLAAQAAGRRFGERGLVVFWLAGSAALAALAKVWLGMILPDSSRPWSQFVIPFLFLLVEIGAVAGYLAWSTRRGEHGRRQALFGLAAFTLALLPAVMVAQIPSMLQNG